jgi:AraC-like DNA-binding protein
MDGMVNNMDVLVTIAFCRRRIDMDTYKQAEHFMTRGSPVGAVGLETDKVPMMEHSRGRALRYHAVMYILAGRGFFMDETNPRREITPGTVFYLYPGRWHYFDPAPGTAWTEYWVLFHGADAERRFGNLIPPVTRPIHAIGRNPTLTAAYEELYDVYLYGSRGYGQYATYLLHKILMEVFLAIETIDVPRQNALIHRTRDFIGKNLSSPDLDFKSQAKVQRMSYERFRKRFRAATGLAPKQYHLAAKINRAREQLTNTQFSIKEIAAGLGFHDALYFSRIFKTKVGMSPAQFRREQLAVPNTKKLPPGFRSEPDEPPL